MTKRLAEYGPNKLPEGKRNPVLVYLGYMWNPLSWAMEVRFAGRTVQTRCRHGCALYLVGSQLYARVGGHTVCSGSASGLAGADSQ